MVPHNPHLCHAEGAGEANQTASILIGTLGPSEWHTHNSGLRHSFTLQIASGAQVPFLAVGAHPTQIIMRHQRGPLAPSAALHAPRAHPSPVLRPQPPMPVGAAPTMADSDEEDAFLRSEPPQGGLGPQFVATDSTSISWWLSEAQTEGQYLAHSPSPPPPAQPNRAPCVAAASLTPAPDAQPAGAAPASVAAASSASAKPEPQSSPTRPDAVPRARASGQGRRQAARTALSPLPAIKKEQRYATRSAAAAAASTAAANGKETATLLSSVKTESELNESGANAPTQAGRRGGRRRNSAPRPRQERRPGQPLGGGRRQPTGNEAGRPAGSASPYVGLTADDLWAYLLDEGGDMLDCSKTVGCRGGAAAAVLAAAWRCVLGCAAAPHAPPSATLFRRLVAAACSLHHAIPHPSALSAGFRGQLGSEHEQVSA